MFFPLIDLISKEVTIGSIPNLLYYATSEDKIDEFLYSIDGDGIY